MRIVAVAVAGIALVVAASAAIAASRSSAAVGPFDGLPTVAPGQLPGRVVYLTRLGCQLHEYDLASDSDRQLGDADLCTDGLPVIAPDGAAVAERVSNGSIAIVRPNGTRRIIGTPLPRGKPPSATVELPQWVGSGRVAYCAYSKRSVSTVLADAGSGKQISRLTHSCEVAFTKAGPAVVRKRSVVIGWRVVYRFPDAIAANTSPGVPNPPLGNPLATNAAGTLLAVATRPVRSPRTVVVQVLRPDGRRVSRSSGASDIAVSFQTFAPNGTSAVVWWGDILQLAPLRIAPGRFALRYHQDNGATEDEALWQVAYEPAGAYAVMPREPLAIAGAPRPSPLPAIVFAASSLKPLYQLPIDAQAAIWAEP